MPDVTNPPFADDSVRMAFWAVPVRLRQRLLALRALIYETAAQTEGVGRIEETLKWGEPSYLTPETKSGTTIRLAPVRGDDSRYGLFVHCQTTLVDTWRQTYPDLFTCDGTRAITFSVEEEIPREPLAHCIALALCYHLDKKRGARG